MLKDFFYFLGGEKSGWKETAPYLQDFFKPIAKAWLFCHNDWVISVEGIFRYFMNYKVQIDKSLYLAATLIPRLHPTAGMRELRFATENMVMCLYLLKNSEELIHLVENATDPIKPLRKLNERAKVKMKEIDPVFDRHIKNIRNDCSEFFSHASISAALSSTKLSSDKKKLHSSIYDTTTPALLARDLMYILGAQILFLDAIKKFGVGDKFIKLQPPSDDLIVRVKKQMLPLRQKLRQAGAWPDTEFSTEIDRMTP